MEKFPVRKVVVSGALGAVSVVMALTPIGFLPWFGGVSITIMHIPVIVAAVLEGPIAGTIVGLIFGVTGMIKAATTPLTPLDPVFASPLISVLPRLFIGIVAWGVFSLFRGKLRPLAAGAAGALGGFTNTVLVLGSLWLFSGAEVAKVFQVDPSALPAVFTGIALSNGLIEAAAAAVFTSAVVSAWLGIAGNQGRSKLSSGER